MAQWPPKYAIDFGLWYFVKLLPGNIFATVIIGIDIIPHHLNKITQPLSMNHDTEKSVIMLYRCL